MRILNLRGMHSTSRLIKYIVAIFTILWIFQVVLSLYDSLTRLMNGGIQSLYSVKIRVNL